MIAIKEVVPKPNKGGKTDGLYNLASGRFDLGQINTSAIPKHNGKFITGLDKYTPGIRDLSTEKEREEATKKAIDLRKSLESRLGTSLDQDTEEGYNFYRDYIIDFNEISLLNVEKNPEDLLLYTILMANQYAKDFPIALSKEELTTDVLQAKEYVLYDSKIEMNKSVSAHKLEMQVSSLIFNWYTENQERLKNVGQLVLPISIQITSDTDIDYIFDTFGKYVKGDLGLFGHKSIQAIHKEILKYASLEDSEIIVRASVSKGLAYRFIRTNLNGLYYYTENEDLVFGNTIESVYDFFLDPVNKKFLGNATNGAPDSLRKMIKNKEMSLL